MACRPRLWRKPSQPCFLPSKRWPVLSFNTSLTRTQHDEARSQAPPLPSCSRSDVHQPLRLEKEYQSRPWHTRLNPDDNLAAQEVQEGPQTPTADMRDVPESRLPFTCDECGSMFRNEQGLHDHHSLNKSQQSIWGQAGGCKNRIPVAGTKVKPHVLKVQDPRDLRFTVGIGDKIFEIPSRDLKPSTVAVSQDSGYQIVNTFNAKSETASFISVPGSPPFWKGHGLPIYLPQRVFEKDQPREQNLQPFNLLLLSKQLMSSESRYVQGNIFTNVSLLRTLLRFCRGQGVGTYRFLLRKIQGSLFLAHDSTLSVLKGNEHGALRSALPKRCTEMPPGLEHSTHYRSVQYSLGHLNCVVQSKFDALCSNLPGKIQTPSSLSSVGPVTSQEYHPHREVAMIQTQRNGGKWKGPPVETLWLSRTPFLLRAYLSDDDNLTKVSKFDAVAAARKWEKDEKQQLALRKLATLLSDLKRAVKAAAPGGQACIGLIDRHLDPPTIQVFLSEHK